MLRASIRWAAAGSEHHDRSVLSRPEAGRKNRLFLVSQSPEMSGPRQEALGHVVELMKRQETDRLSFYKPFPYQIKVHGARDAQGHIATEVCFMAGNRSGKTHSAVHDGAIHLTGRYPDWWTGPRYPKNINCWAGGITNLTTRDILQRGLFGPPENKKLIGTGSIPKDAIEDVTPRRGVPDAIDSALIRHESGKLSRIQFLSYEMGKDAWMGQGVDLVLLDEEPPLPIMNQARRGTTLSPYPRILLSFTPEHGMTEVAREFFLGPLKSKQALIMASLNDRPDLTDEQVDAIIERYPEHEQKMRRSGQPIFGAALVLPASESQVRVPDFEIPAYWPRISGLDFGYFHPAAGAWAAINPDNDYMVIYRGFRVKRASPPEVVALMNSGGREIPWIWPHDGLQDRGLGPLAAKYRELGANMLPFHFQNPDIIENGKRKAGGISKAPGIEEMRERENSARLQVFASVEYYFDERRTWYYDEKGKPGEINEDFLSASRYAVMSARFARPLKSWRNTQAFGQDVAEGAGTSYDPGHNYGS